MRLNVVLFEPEIPQNTGNIIRSCVGFNAKLHIIKPYNFSLDDKSVKRARLDYFEYLTFEEYESLDDFIAKNKGRYIMLSRYGHKSPITIDFNETDEDIYLIFGKESTGLPYEFLHDNLDKCYRIPTTDKVRSLNLSNCAAIMLFLASAQLNDPLLIGHEPECYKGEFFIDNFTK